jgi:Ca2+-binding RTX toxin-like protein
MAVVKAYQGVNLLAPDLNWYIRNGYDALFADNIFLPIDGKVYEDAAYVEGRDGTQNRLLLAGGSGVVTDQYGNITGGTVQFMGEADLSTGLDIWTVKDIAISAAAFDRAAVTSSNSDDIQLMSVALSGNDEFYLSSQSDAARGFGGHDLAFLGGGNDTFYGDDGADFLFGEAGNDYLNGGLDGDQLKGGTGNDRIDGGAGADRAYFTDPMNATVNLGLTTAQNTGHGIDTILNIEHVTTGSGHDRLTGNSLANSLVSGAGNDVLDGAGGNDTLTGDAGSDTLTGGTGNDRIDGGAGSDRASFTGSAAATVNLSLATAQNTGHGVDTILNVEHVTSGTGNDRLTGNALANNFVSGAGNDVLNGAAGNDTLAGGAGSDTLTGGSGSDSFVFNAALGSGNVDRITDFNAVADTVRLENAIFARLAEGTLSASAFTSNTSGNAADASDRIIYESDTGRLYYDSDGTGAAAKVHFATLATGLTLTSADFFVF